MVNKRFLQTAERWKNPSLPAEKTQSVRQTSQNPAPIQNARFPNLPKESFLFSYNGKHKDYFQELISKVNAIYSGTNAKIPTGKKGEIQGNLIKRMALVSTIANDSNLRSACLYPITATQSEYLLQASKSTNPKNNWEDFGIVLYDRSKEGYNPQEAQAIYDSLKAHRQDLSLSESDLENRLIIVNPGAEVDSSMPHGVKPIIIPGITQVYTHEVLEKVGEDPNFEGYGLNGGLPLLNQLGNGSRTLYMPNETKDIGCRMLYRGRSLGLGARDEVLAYSNSGGRVSFAPQGHAP
jgi:hypothetical protein